jgi:DNA-binding MarR family transcriptional regulator
MEEFETDLDNLESAVRLLVQTIKRPQQWAKVTALAGVTIDRPAAVILQTLMSPRAQGWRVHDLAAQLGIEAPSVTRKTQELEQAGYVRRTRNSNDRRAIGLQLTTQGRSVNNRIKRAQRQNISQVLQSWPAAKRREFVTLLQQFSQDLAAQLSPMKVK